MSKIFFKYSLFIASFFVIMQIYLTISHNKDLEKDKNDLLQKIKVQKVLNLLRTKKEFKSFAAVIDDTNTYAFGYVSNHRTQKSADKTALIYCKKERIKRKINKSCKLYNSLLDLNNQVQY